MLSLNSDQWQALRADDARRFVSAVADQLIASQPSLEGSRNSLLASLNAMHRLAAEVGFASTVHVIRLLHLAAHIPDLHDDSFLRSWLTRPGQSPEQRLDDLMAVIDHRLHLHHHQGPL